MLFKRIIKQTLYDVVPETATKVLKNSVNTSWCEISHLSNKQKICCCLCFLIFNKKQQ